jgi:hypothetical protein
MVGQLDTFIAFAVVILGVSMLVTVLNQMITALLGLRGTNLRWGLETLFEQVDPRLAADARAISERVLQHPLVSDSTWSKTHHWPVIGPILARWRLASAIKVGELLNILRKIAEPIPPGGTPTTLEQRLTQFLAQHDAEAATRAAAAATALHAVAPHALDKIDTLLPHVATQVRHAKGDLELWFDSVMDRVSQRFALRMRLWTVVFSFIVAFLLHLDASVLLTSIRSDPQLRAELVASASAMTQQAEKVFGISVASIYQSAADTLKATTPALANAAPPAAPLTNERDGVDWIGQHVTDEAARSEAVTRYRALVQEKFGEFTRNLKAMSDTIQQQLGDSGFTLIPDYGVHQPGWWPDWLPLSTPANGAPHWYTHFLGILATAALHSLGAPFWFHTLKSASSLRPVVASKEREDRAQRT